MFCRYNVMRARPQFKITSVRTISPAQASRFQLLSITFHGGFVLEGTFNAIICALHSRIIEAVEASFAEDAAAAGIDQASAAWNDNWSTIERWSSRSIKLALKMLAILKPKYWRKPNSTQVNTDLHKAISVLFLSAYYYILWRDIFSAIFFRHNYYYD